MDTVDGVEVVTAGKAPETWALEPLYRVGELGDGGELGPEAFQSIASLALGDHGTLWVADAGQSGAQEIRVFGAEGEHLRTIGRQGEGPGEFGTLQSIAWIDGDTLAAFDPGNGRIALLSPHGDWLGQWPYEQAVSGSPRVVRLYPAGGRQLYGMGFQTHRETGAFTRL